MKKAKNRTSILPSNAIDCINRYMIADTYPLVVDLERSKGNRIYDAKAQREYLDCFSYVASNPIGHNHPKMFDSAFERKLLRTARNKPSSSDFITVEKAEFVETLSRLALPEDMTHLFLVEGGAVAVENAMKAAFDWKVQKNRAKGEKGTKGQQILHFKQAFHGRCGYTLSVTNTADERKTRDFPKFDWPRVTNPKITFPLNEVNLQEVKRLEEQAYQEIEAAFAKSPGDIAAILIETVQGEGGDNHFRAELLTRLREIADEKEVLLIFDEIQCGGGLTGTMWAFERFAVIPDIVCFGKKFQVCGMAAGPRMDEVEKNVFVEASRVNSTWGGGLTDMVRAQRYLEIIDEDGLLENARKVGEYFQDGLRKLSVRYPDIISNARGLGLLCAIDVDTRERRDAIVKSTFQNGAIVLKCGTSSLRFRPALIFGQAEVDELMAILSAAIETSS